jgi:hypothetical protein
MTFRTNGGVERMYVICINIHQAFFMMTERFQGCSSRNTTQHSNAMSDIKLMALL